MSGTDLEIDNSELKRVRAGHLSNAKRKFSHFQEALINSSKEETRVRMDVFRSAFQEFVSWHQRYLDSGIDQEETERVSEQYQSLMNEIIEAEKSVREMEGQASVGSRSIRSRTLSETSSIRAKKRLMEATIKKEYILKQQQLEREAEEVRRKSKLLAVEEEIAIAKQLADIELEVLGEMDPANDREDVTKPFMRSDEPKTVGKASANETLGALNALAQAIRQGPSLPKVELMKFSGDPAEYAEFSNNFKTNIETYVDNENERLTRLISQCTGRAADAIRSCVNLPAGIKYKKAWETLKENFGLSYMVAEAQINKLKAAQCKKADASGLLEFSRRLEESKRVLDGLGHEYSDRLNNDDLIKLLIRKFPHESLKHRWVDKVGDLLKKQPRIYFEDFIKFVRDQGQKLNNAYGEEINKGKVNTSNRIMTLQATSKFTACPKCNGRHPLWKCDDFKAMEVSERMRLIYKERLCKKCINGKHFSNDCKKDFKCKTCGKPHNTLLHNDNHKPDRRVQDRVIPQENCRPNIHESTEIISATTNSHSKVYFKIVPVIVEGKHGRVQTNAFLDNGSDTSLCSSKLADVVGLRNRRKLTYNVSTITGEKEISGEKGMLRILSVDGTTSLDLTCLSTDKIPVDETSMAGHDELMRYDYLKDVSLPIDRNSSVDILIGSDHAYLIETQLEVRRGKPNEPVAIRTPFGWTVSGPTLKLQQYSHHINFIKKESEIFNKIQQLYNAEFPDSITHKQGWAPEDVHANSIMQQSVTLVNGHYQIKLPFRSTSDDLNGNYLPALNRLNSLRRRLIDDLVLKEQYKEVIDRYEDEGACS